MQDHEVFFCKMTFKLYYVFGGKGALRAPFSAPAALKKRGARLRRAPFSIFLVRHSPMIFFLVVCMAIAIPCIRKVLRTWVREHSVRESREQSIGFLSPRNGAPSNLTKSNSNGFQYEINLSVKGRS